MNCVKCGGDTHIDVYLCDACWKALDLGKTMIIVTQWDAIEKLEELAEDGDDDINEELVSSILEDTLNTEKLLSLVQANIEFQLENFNITDIVRDAISDYLMGGFDKVEDITSVSNLGKKILEEV